MRRAARKGLLVALLALFAWHCTIRSAHASDDITVADLQATARALGFLDSLPRDGTIVVGIVYAPGVQDSKALAARAAGSLGALPGPNKSVFRTKIVSIDNLAQATDRLDAIFLVPGLSPEAATIIDVTRRRHLVSISTDPACLDANCCVLMVRTTSGVEIVLDTGLAAEVGVKFSTVFTMMVKRR